MAAINYKVLVNLITTPLNKLYQGRWKQEKVGGLGVYPRKILKRYSEIASESDFVFLLALTFIAFVKHLSINLAVIDCYNRVFNCPIFMSDCSIRVYDCSIRVYRSF